MINPSANLFVFGDFNIYHKDWLTYSGRTNKPGELFYNFSISNDLSLLLNFPTQISDNGSHSPALLDLFLSSDASICSTKDFSPVGNSDHVVVSVSIDFPSNSKWNGLFHPGIYPSSFTNIHFRTKTELSNVIKCRWGSQGVVFSTRGSWWSPTRGSGSKALEKHWPPYIWRANKWLKAEET